MRKQILFIYIVKKNKNRTLQDSHTPYSDLYCRNSCSMKEVSENNLPVAYFQEVIRRIYGPIYVRSNKEIEELTGIKNIVNLW